MSLPDENLRALKRSQAFLREILYMNKNTFRKMTADEFESWRLSAYSCLRHYPMDHQLDQLYADTVCRECGQGKPFHKMGCESKGD
jgi:hypothetical protein